MKKTDEQSLCLPEILNDSEKIQNYMKDLSETENALQSSMNRWEDLVEIIDKIEKGE